MLTNTLTAMLAYHEATKHTPERLRRAAYTLDWANMPKPFRHYDGVPVIVVEGVIVSQANMAVDVPRLRFAVQNGAGHEVYTWTAVAAQPVLEPGARLPFKSRLASPPQDAHNIVVRFFTRRDAVAGLR
jgi:hypothetical protein